MVVEGVLTFWEGTGSDMVVQGHWAVGPQLGLFPCRLESQDGDTGGLSRSSAPFFLLETVFGGGHGISERLGGGVTAPGLLTPALHAPMLSCVARMRTRAREGLGLHPDHLRRKVLSRTGQELPRLRAQARGWVASAGCTGPAWSLLSSGPLSDGARGLKTPSWPRQLFFCPSIHPSNRQACSCPTLFLPLLPGPVSSATWASSCGTYPQQSLPAHPPPWTELPKCCLLSLRPAPWLIPGWVFPACPHAHPPALDFVTCDILFAFEEPSEVLPSPHGLSQ